jgi:predicted solute-binding protein
MNKSEEIIYLKKENLRLLKLYEKAVKTLYKIAKEKEKCKKIKS